MTGSFGVVISDTFLPEETVWFSVEDMTGREKNPIKLLFEAKVMADLRPDQYFTPPTF